MPRTINFTLKGVAQTFDPNSLKDYKRPGWFDWFANPFAGQEPGKLIVVIRVEPKDIDGNRVSGLCLELIREGEVTTDVFYDGLMDNDNINKVFTVMDLRLGEGLIEIRDEFLTVPRNGYYNIVPPRNVATGLNKPEQVFEWECPDDAKITAATDAELGAMIDSYNLACKFDKTVWEYTSLIDIDGINSTGVYWEVNIATDYNNYVNNVMPKAGKKSTTTALKVGESLLLTSPAKTRVQAETEFINFKNQLKDKIDVLKIEIPKLRRFIADWKAAGNLTDLEHNQEVDRWNETTANSEISKKYDEIAAKVNGGDPKYTPHKGKFDQDSANEVEAGVKANRNWAELGTPEKIAEDQLRVGETTDKQNIKTAFKDMRILRDKILARKQVVIGQIEDLVKNGGGGDNKYTCAKCGKQFDKTTQPPVDGRYCSQKCKNEANQQGDKYICAKCGEEKSGTPTIINGNKYCANCKDQVNDNNDNQNRDQNEENSNLSSFQTQVIQAINNELNNDPKISTSELDSDYRNWENQIKGFSKEEDIKNLKDQVISNIIKKRIEKKNQKRFDKGLEDLKNKKGSELAESIKKLVEETEGSKGYNGQQIDNEITRAWQEDQATTKNTIKEIVEGQMAKRKVKVNELGSAEKTIYNKIKNKEYNDLDQLKTDKNKLLEFIGNKEAEK